MFIKYLVDGKKKYVVDAIKFNFIVFLLAYVDGVWLIILILCFTLGNLFN